MRLNRPSFTHKYRLSYGSLAGLFGLTGLAIVIHGYHLGIEDQAIYLPAILRNLDPTLFPRNAFFFEAQTSTMLLGAVVAGFVRHTHVQLPWVLLLFHLLSIFLLLLACWRIARRCFADDNAVWAGLAVVTCMLTLPIAGTAQFIVDQYLHPRALATAFVLFPVADLLPGAQRLRGWKLFPWCGLWFLLALVVHFQMAVFGLGLFVFLYVPWEKRLPALGQVPLLLAGIPVIGRLLSPGSPAWQEAARTRAQHYLLRWEWYEILGILAPIPLLWWFAKLAEKRSETVASWLCRRLALFGALTLIGGAALILPPRLERLTPYQPMRIFILIYIFLLLIGGGLLSELVLRKVVWRWVALFLPMALGMYLAQIGSFPNSPHIEWPGRSFNNDWVKAFVWVRANTPKNAYFALNPHYLSEAGEDYHGFRAWAWRSEMADMDKDPGVVSLMPDLAPEWQREVHSLRNWNQFTCKDFESLGKEMGANWLVLERRLPTGQDRQLPEILDCPYQNASVYVCKFR